MNMSTLRYLVSGAFLAALLGGCSIADEDEIKQWMSEVRRDVRPAVQAIPEPKKFEPFVYQQGGNLDPFSKSKVEVALQKMASRTSSGLRPDLDRRREPLETFPIDMVRMVGTLQKNNAKLALIQVEKTIYQAQVGNYVGQNFGVITKITETEVTLKEIVQDAASEWVERISTLQLQESK
jgi:type IV pilus assembly protein PilP